MAADTQTLINQRLNVSPDAIAAFCQRWQITELALFGSILRDDFRPDSDIDILITLANDAQWSLLDWVDMQDQLKQLLGRDVDIADKKGLKNPYRRHEILSNYQVIYANQQS